MQGIGYSCGPAFGGELADQVGVTVLPIDAPGHHLLAAVRTAGRRARRHSAHNLPTGTVTSSDLR